MNEQQTEYQVKKSKNRHLSIIFWIILIIFAYFAGQYLFGELRYKQAKEDATSQFSNIEAEIYQTPDPALPIKIEEDKLDNQPLDQNEVLLKQQLQIAQLQNDLNNLKEDLTKLKTNDGLAKIIFNFIKLQDLVETKQNYDSQLQKLEMLSRADFALINKIEKLKSTLQNHPKNHQELARKFTNLIPQIKAKQVEVYNGKTWLGKIKSITSQFITIKRTDQNTGSDVELFIVKTQNAIKNREFDQALRNFRLIGDEYREIVENIKVDLKNTNSFEKINNEIYQYLEILSN